MFEHFQWSKPMMFAMFEEEPCFQIKNNKFRSPGAKIWEKLHPKNVCFIFRCCF